MPVDTATLAILGLGGAGAVAIASQGGEKSSEDAASTAPPIKHPGVLEQARANIATGYATKFASSKRLAANMTNAAQQRVKKHDGFYQRPKQPNQPADTLGESAKPSDDFAAEQKIAEEIEKELKKKLDSLGDKAKAEGAKFLNEQFGTNIPPDASWDDIKKQLVPALAGAGAGAGCSALATPATGPICSALGAALGAYLQEEIGPYLEDAWQKVEDWFEGAGEDIADAAEDAWNWLEEQF